LARGTGTIHSTSRIRCSLRIPEQP
jgi:hypothetical protein